MDQSKALQANRDEVPQGSYAAEQLRCRAATLPSSYAAAYVGEWHPILKKECTQEFSVLELLQFMEENSNILSKINPDNLRFTVGDAPTSNYRVIIIYEVRP